MVTRAAEVPASHQWQSDPFEGNPTQWRTVVRNNIAALGFVAAMVLLVIGWLLRDRQWLSAEEGVGYALGVISVSCMLILLLYPLRKRFRILKFIGPLPKWFRNHMVLGVSAPIAALYHCNFQLGSLNSQIALYSALMVAGSGLVGRFIYAKIHRGLYGRKTNLRELLARVKMTTPGVGQLGTFVPELTKRMTEFDRAVMVPPESILDCIRLPFSMALRTRLQYFRLMRFAKVSLVYQSQRSVEIANHRKQLQKTIRDHIKLHLHHVRRVAEFTAYDRLFALWHKLHFPFFVILLVTVVVHVAVVHLY